MTNRDPFQCPTCGADDRAWPEHSDEWPGGECPDPWHSGEGGVSDRDPFQIVREALEWDGSDKAATDALAALNQAEAARDWIDREATRWRERAVAAEAERDRLHKLYNAAQDDASKAAEDMVRYRTERGRLQDALQDIAYATIRCSHGVKVRRILERAARSPEEER